MPGKSGNATQAQTRRADDILNILAGAPHRVKVIFIATDGNRGYDSMFLGQFPHWFPGYRLHGLAACPDIIQRIYLLYVEDWLHLAKKNRARILKHTPVLRFQGRQVNILQEAMNNILHLDPVFTDLSSTVKERWLLHRGVSDQACDNTTAHLIQTVVSRDRRMDISHIVGMRNYKAKYSFSLRQISLVFLGRFCALNFSVL
jgi:hypothetical protein